MNKKISALVKIEKIMKRVSPSCVLNIYRYKRDHRKWSNAGKPIPPPDRVKQMIVKEYAKKHGNRIFIETGTYLGDMVNAVRNDFDKIFSIELSAELYEKVKKKFSKYEHISIIKGDSSKVLPEVLNHLEEPCLFWLDGHFSEGITARGEKETPILEELNQILGHPVRDHVILIDDARCFTGESDYPTLVELRELILSRCPDNVFEVRDDIIRSHKK